MRTRRNRKRPKGTQREKPFFSKVGGQPTVEANTQDGFFQRKLIVGKPGDRFEQEADKQADAVVNRTRTGLDVLQRKEKVQRQPEEEEDVQAMLEVQRQAEEEEEPVQTQAENEEESVQTQEENEEETVQTQEEEEEPVQAQEEEEPVQTQDEEEVQTKGDIQLKGDKDEEPVQAKSEGPSTSPAFTAMLKQRKGKGRPLPRKVREEMEASFKSDFSSVRIHTDEEAIQLSKMLGAQAFTRGNDIFFNRGKFDPESSTGKHLLAHELTHTQQQRKD